MQSNDENYFLKLSNWSDELAKVEGRIAARVKQESFPDLDSEDDDSSEPIEDGGRRRKRQQPRFREVSRGEELSSLYERRESLLLEFQRVYVKFAQERFDNIEELREPSPLGELFAQCAFAVGATLESFFTQFENLVDHNNSTVETLLTLSEELDFADQSRDDQEPLVGLGVVHLADEEGHTRGIRSGDQEAEFIDGICTRKDFTNNLASMIRQSTERILDHETQRVVEQAPFSVNGDREYVYGVSSRPGSRVAQATSTFWPSFGIQETVHYPMVPVDWSTEKRETPKKPDSLFWRVVSTNNYIKQLTSEARMITDHFDSLGRSCPDIDPSVEDMDGSHEEARAIDPAFEELECIKLQIYELRRELEPAFLELAATELAPIVTSASELSQESIRDCCRAAVEAIITRYAVQWGSLHTLNNNVTYHLIHFSAYLDSSQASITTPVILRDPTQTRSCGIRVDDKEFRFVGVKDSMDSFKQSVLSAVDEWVHKREVKQEKLQRSVVDNHCLHFPQTNADQKRGPS